LHQLHKGVYALLPPPALPPLAREQAAILVCGERSVISHHTAAGVSGMRPQSHDAVDVTVVGHERGRGVAGIHVHRRAHLYRPDVRWHQGLPVTAPARTLLDIAPLLSERELERTVDDVIARRLVTRSALIATLARYPRQPGSRVLGELCQESPSAARRVSSCCGI
jgi:hypothetical protein